MMLSAANEPVDVADAWNRVVWMSSHDGVPETAASR